MKFLYLALAIILYVVTVSLIYYLHVSLFRVNVVFYAAIWDAILAAFLVVLCCRFIPVFRIFSNFETVQIGIVCLLIGYALAISVPTVIDRSLSFYILEKIAQRGGGIQQDRFEDVFTKEYVKEHRLMDVRLTEQLESNTIMIEDGCVSLTPKGEFLAQLSRYFRQHFLPKERLLLGEYSDDLTDPFRKSVTDIDYECG